MFSFPHVRGPLVSRAREDREEAKRKRKRGEKKRGREERHHRSLNSSRRGPEQGVRPLRLAPSSQYTAVSPGV